MGDERETTRFLGLDFGTESVRAVIVTARGELVGAGVAPFPHGQIVPGSDVAARLFDLPLPPSFALQHPRDWLEAATAATAEALRAGEVEPDAVRGIGVDFTSCTVLPTDPDGIPLCLEERVEGAVAPRGRNPHSWPKLWKHHGALEPTLRMNQVARDRSEPWLSRYGGVIGLEWLLPKALEVIEKAPEVADATALWIEAGDWFVWQLVGTPEGDAAVPRSTCQAGYKGLWSVEHGFPGDDYLNAVHPGLGDWARTRLAGRFVSPGKRAGDLCPAWARRLGLRPGIAVSAAIIDAHSGVPGAGVGEPGTLVMVVGTSGCHMLLGRDERPVPGVAGVVEDGILPGFFGYETGQAALGDAFDLVRRLTGQSSFDSITREAGTLAPGSDGVSCVDWFHGCRTPLMDGALTGGFTGLTLDTTPAHLLRSTLEASACGLRWIVDTLRDGGVPIERFVATGGIATRNPLFMQICASVLEAPIETHGAEHGPALGAAILGALAAGSEQGGFDDAGEAVHHMSGAGSVLPPPVVTAAEASWIVPYRELRQRYGELTRAFAAEGSPLRAARRKTES